MDPRWLGWARSLQAIAQNGLAYATDPFDRERYRALREIAVDIMAAHSGTDVNTLHALFANQEGYATPKVDVRGAVLDEGAILLVRERRDGLWTLPGGWADVNEAPSEAVTREVYEEPGWRTRAVKLLAVYDRTRHGHAPYPPPRLQATLSV